MSIITSFEQLNVWNIILDRKIADIFDEVNAVLGECNVFWIGKLLRSTKLSISMHAGAFHDITCRIPPAESIADAWRYYKVYN